MARIIRLEAVSTANSSGLQSFALEFAEAGEAAFSLAASDPRAYLARAEDFSKGRNLPPQRVQGHEFWLFRGDRILGNSRLRTRLIPEIELDGGHISYSIRPSERRKGYGTELLRLTLAEARRRGLASALLTTSPSNVGSIGVIERNGGRLLDRPTSPFTGEQLLRFVIAIDAGDAREADVEQRRRRP